MSLLHLLDLSSVWSEYGQAMTKTDGVISSAAVNQYWVASRLRSDTWHELLFLYSEAIQKSGVQRRASLWHALDPVIQEILISEMLTRVVAAVAAMMEEAGVDSDSSAVASNLLSSHVEARNRSLKLVALGLGAAREQEAKLQKLRVGLELWTDYFLAKLGESKPIQRCAHDLKRVKHWHREWSEQRSLRQSHRVIEVGSLRCWAQSLWCGREASPRCNQRIGSAVMAMLRSNSFDSLGILQSSEFLRLTRVIEESDRAWKMNSTPFSSHDDPLCQSEAARIRSARR